MPLAFLLDEHLRGPVWQSILRHNLGGDYLLDTVRIGDVPDLPPGAQDSEVLMWAERETRLLITEDRQTMAGHLRRHLADGHHSPGIIMVRTGISMRNLMEFLALIAYAGDPAEFADTITFVP
jgi:hypothetical protein